MRITEEQIQFLKNNVVGTHNSDLIRLFYNKFGIMLTDGQLKHYKRRFNLKNGLNTRFNHEQIPHNKKEEGEEFVSNYDGYVYIKINDKWVLKHRYLYEKEHGAIPKGKSVVFADQNKNNFDINNLILIDDRDKLVMKNKHLFTTNAELTKTGVLIAKLSNKCYDKNKEIK